MGLKLDHALGLYLEGIRDGRAREAVTKYTGERYTQHSTGVADGIEGFLAFFEPFLAAHRDRDIRVLRTIEDGAHVFCHVSQSLDGGAARWVTTDLFDTDANDRIVEHWDVIEPWRSDTIDGRSQVAGPSRTTDLERTDANKALVRRFVNEVLIERAFEGMGPYVTDDLVQHDLRIANGREAFAKDLDDRAVGYTEIFRLVGEGNFVATYCKVDIETVPHAVFDLYRLSGNRIVERWVNTEPVPEDSGNSGKF